MGHHYRQVFFLIEQFHCLTLTPSIHRIDFVKAVTQSITNLPSDIAGITGGEKVDPLTLFKKFEEAAKLLNSGKTGDAQKGSTILASISDASESFKKLFGDKALLNLQTKAGISGIDVSKARGAASAGQVDFSSIQESIRKNLSGQDLFRALKATKEAESDPSKISSLIEQLKKSGTTQFRGGAGADIISSLSGIKSFEISKTFDFSAIQKSLEETLSGKNLAFASKTLEQSKLDPSKIDNLIESLKKIYGPTSSQLRGNSIVEKLSGQDSLRSYEPTKKALQETLSGDSLNKALKALESANGNSSNLPELIKVLKEVYKPNETQRKGASIISDLSGAKVSAFEDESVTGLNEQQKQLSVELGLVSEQVKDFREAFKGNNLTTTIDTLTTNVRLASENLKDFTTFTSQLSSLSSEIGPRLNACASALRQQGASIP